MKRFVAVCLLLASFSSGLAQSLDDQYLQIFGLIEEADSVAEAQPEQAMAKYAQARNSLQKLQQNNPSWNSSVISFRLGYVADRMKALSAKVPMPAVAAPGTNAPAPKPAATPAAPAGPPPPADWAEQLTAQKQQVQQLSNDKALLEAKLKEAFAARPAQVDPQEMARAEEKIKALQKENDLLKVTLDQSKAKPATAADPKALEQAQQALTESNRQLAAQKELAGQLTLEKQALQERLRKAALSGGDKATSLAAENESLKKQLAEAKAAPSPANQSDETARQLADARRELAALKETATRLGSDKQALETQVKALTEESQKTAELKSENTSLRKQLADSKPAPAANAKAEESARQLEQAQKQLASAQAEKETLRLEKTALEERVKKLTSTTVTSTVLPPPSSPQDVARIRDLELERDALQKKLDAADKALYGRKGKVVARQVEDLEGQLAAMRARLEVFEARQVPYSAEELALLKTPATKLVEPAPNAGKKSVKELPPGSAAQVAQAQRLFATKQYDQAEAIYQQLLREDSRNVPLLANLAAIQVEARQFDAAEANLRQALSVAADDAYTLYVFGILHFRRAHYDAAMDALSRAAKLDPKNAEVQNYLGLTLSQKGMRGPAETAFRKAIELQPNFGSAHVNLAVFYITQNPPYAALAKWHYQKALESGHPHSPTLEKMLETAK